MLEGTRNLPRVNLRRKAHLRYVAIRFMTLCDSRYHGQGSSAFRAEHGGLAASIAPLNRGTLTKVADER